MHYHVIVLVRPEETPTEALIAGRLAPHEESYAPGPTEDDEGTYNGHWDWWVIGGRWDGVLYPEKDDGHVCPDFHCGYSDFHHQPTKNIRTVAEIPEGVEKRIAAILTPDDQWIEPVPIYDHPEFPGWEGEGYRALSDRLDEEWQQQVRRVLVEHSACTAVSVDCHS